MHSVLLLMMVVARIYVADSDDNKITVIDSGKAVGAISVSPEPQGLAASPEGRRLYVASAGRNVLDVIDRKTARLTRSVPVGPRPGNLAITPDGRRVYVSIGGRPAIDIVDTASLMKVKSIETRGSPQGIYVTPDGTRMLVGSAGGISVINIRTEEIEFEIPVTGVPLSIAIDSDRHLAIQRLFVKIAGMDGFEIVDYASRKVTGKIPLPASNFVASSPDHKSLWVTAADSVTVFSLPDLKRFTTIQTGAGADAIAFEPDGKRCFVSNTAANSVSEIDTANFRTIAQIPVGRAPKQLIDAE